jgi:hypothetical protein
MTVLRRITTMRTNLVIKDEGHENYKAELSQGFFFGLFVAAIIAALAGWTAEHNQPVTDSTFGYQR